VATAPVAAEPKPEPIPEPVGGAAPPKTELKPESVAEVVIGPAIQPKTVEEAATAAPRRGGWWKR